MWISREEGLGRADRSLVFDLMGKEAKYWEAQYFTLPLVEDSSETLTYDSVSDTQNLLWRKSYAHSTRFLTL